MFSFLSSPDKGTSTSLNVEASPSQPPIISPVALISSLEPLKRISAREEAAQQQGQEKSKVKRTEGMLPSNPLAVTAVAPYQAMPVYGKSTPAHGGDAGGGLEVIEHGTMTFEEREKQINAILESYLSKLADRTSHHLGYPYNLDFDYGQLEALGKFSINNLGDPFIESNYGVHSREFEVGVLNWFAKLWEIDEDEYWGYITTCGTEGNLHGIYVGRENLPDGILYASQESHYSVFKAARMYRMDAEKIKTLETGEIDYDDLKRRLISNKGRPAILNVNIGTTVKGAVDDLDLILAILNETGYSEDKFFIHCDGALFGMMMPFIGDGSDSATVTFKKPIGSVSVSGHKFVGAPVPCGVVITRFKYVMALSTDVEYLNSRDATIMGSRNGHAPIYLWYTLTRKGYDGIKKDVEKCMRNSRTLKQMLLEAGVKATLNDLSNTVVFERPKEEAFIRKWQLACEGGIAHVVVMPNVDIEKLELFVLDLVESRARVSIAAAKAIAADARAAE